MLASRIVAPQKWNVPDLTETCHGIGEGVSAPPTTLSELIIYEGISAKKDLYFIIIHLGVLLKT